jgi:hypothetical protein
MPIAVADISPGAPAARYCPSFNRSWIMKKVWLLVLGLLFFCILPCTCAFAQLPPMPPCCIWTPKGPIAGGMPTLQAKFVVSNQSLEIQGITRDQLLNQTANTFFLGKKVDLVILSKQITSKPVLSDPKWIVMSSEEIIYYRTPRASITTEYLDAVSEIGITDGDSWVKIFFKDGVVDPN